MLFDFELHMYYFSKKERKHLLVQPGCAKFDRIIFDLRIRWPKSSEFGPKSEDVSYQMF